MISYFKCYDDRFKLNRVIVLRKIELFMCLTNWSIFEFDYPLKSRKRNKNGRIKKKSKIVEGKNETKVWVGDSLSATKPAFWVEMCSFASPNVRYGLMGSNQSGSAQYFCQLWALTRKYLSVGVRFIRMLKMKVFL